MNNQNEKTDLQQANIAFKQGDYNLAIKLYESAAIQLPILEKSLAINIKICKSRQKKFNRQIDLTPTALLKQPESLDPFYFNKIVESALFDPSYYQKNYGHLLKDDTNLLSHYLEYGVEKSLNPSASFDTAFYLRNYPDIAVAGINPFIHYVCNGKAEGREALPKPYNSIYTVEPVEYIPRLPADAPAVKKSVRTICFYLPQFHAIPENDKWWGEGFTEWTNVKPAKPQFEGHYQPHVPHEDIGYYNLLDKTTQEKQIELAKQYGIEGFCYYLYWFSGQRLLEKPLDNMLADPALDFPFCVCWANENWSRRWDGLDQDLLMVQNYSDEDDIGFISNIAKYLRDPRYITIDNKPLLLVYRPNLFPDMKATTKRWRDWCRANGIGEIYLAYPQSFECVNPAEYDFDAAIEFPPNNSNPPAITPFVEPIVEDFKATVYDWRAFVERSNAYTDPGYNLFRSATPSWDNTARKKNKGTVFHNSCPKLFQKYLENAFNETIYCQENPDGRLVFINAWNEWAEGAHLEPDERYGYAWLQAVRDAHETVSDKNKRHPAIYDIRRNKLKALFEGEPDREKFGFLTDYENLLRQGKRSGLTYRISDGAPSYILNGKVSYIANRKEMSNICGSIYGDGTYCFVVLQYNKSELTIECVRSITKLEKSGFDVKIVIVDNNSEQSHIEAIRNEFLENSDIVILRSENNKGFSGGNNIGYRFARSELNAKFCVVINNDTKINQSNFIERSIALFNDYSYSILGPDVCVGESRHENPWNDYIFSMADFKHLRDIRANEQKEYMERQEGTFKKIGKSTASSKLIFNPLLQGAAFVVSPIFMANHEALFDERLFLYGEEFLLATDCLMDGDLCLYSSELKIEHHEGASTAELPTYNKMMLGYDSAIKSINLCLNRLERKHDAYLGKAVQHSNTGFLKEQISYGGNHVLIDLLFCQPGYHGGGEYGKAVFKKLAEEYALQGGFELWAAMNPSLFIDQWVWDLCKQYGINVISVETYDDIIDLVNEDIFSSFFTPAIVVYTGYEYMKRVGSKLPFRCDHTKVIGTLHDIRDYELASDHEQILMARKKAGCKYENSISPTEWDTIIKKNSEIADQLREMYRNIISEPRVHLITISKYCEKSIKENIGFPANPMKVLMSPMKSRPSPIKPEIIGLEADDSNFALMLHAGRFEKNAASAIKAFDELFNDVLASIDFKVVLTGINTINQVGIENIHNKSRFIPVGEVEPEALEYLLKTARLLVYPSFNEGLGYPPIEAMSYNTRCAVSSVTAIPEVCGSAVEYFDPYSIHSIKNAIVNSLNSVDSGNLISEQYGFIKAKQESDLESLFAFIVDGSLV
jgi:GT2 family glycosyltransferase